MQLALFTATVVVIIAATLVVWVLRTRQLAEEKLEPAAPSAFAMLTKDPPPSATPDEQYSELVEAIEDARKAVFAEEDGPSGLEKAGEFLKGAVDGIMDNPGLATRMAAEMAASTIVGRLKRAKVRDLQRAATAIKELGSVATRDAAEMFGKEAVEELAEKTAKAVARKTAIKLGLTVLKRASVLLAVLDILDIVCAVLEHVDPYDEKYRKNLRDFALERQHREANQQAVSGLTGTPWPPVMMPGRLFPVEFNQAIDDTRTTFLSLAIYDVFRDQRAPGNANLTTFIEAQVGQDVADKLSAAGVTLAQLSGQMQERVEEYMRRSPRLRDVVTLANLRHRLEAANRRSWHLAQEAPFWYFALCFPATATGSAADVDPRARGLTYSNETVDDIRVSSPIEQNGERFIDIVRAKVPYHEERVRAYEIPAQELDQDMLPTLPELPDIAAARARTATYVRGDNTTVERGFGWRDSNDPQHTDVPGAKHSAWLSLVIFQRFLIKMAKHPGIVRGGRVVHGAFRHGGAVYLAPAPRPWHEDRFVFLDAGDSTADSTAVALTEAAVHRWNEVHSNLFKAGTVPADLVGDLHAAPPPVAVWSDEYPEIAEGSPPPFDRKLALFQNSSEIERAVVQDGRIFMHTSVSTRLVQGIRLSEAQGLAPGDLEDIFGAPVSPPAPGAPHVQPGQGGGLGTSDLLPMQVGGRQVVFLNRNSRFLNRWIPLDQAVLESGRQIKAVEIAETVKLKRAESYTLKVTLASPAPEVRFAQTWKLWPGDSTDGVQLVPKGGQVGLAVGRVALHVGEEQHVFINHTGDMTPGWFSAVSVTTGKLPRKRAMLLDSINAFNVCNGGLADDYSLFPVGVSDAQRADGKGYHINYQDASPFVERHQTSGVPYLNFRNSDLHPHAGAMLRWNPDTRTCAPTNTARLQGFCRNYKGMDYDEGAQNCAEGGGQAVLSFIFGTNVGRSMMRLGHA